MLEFEALFFSGRNSCQWIGLKVQETLQFHTLKYEGSRMGTPLGVNSGVLTWVADIIVEP